MDKKLEAELCEVIAKYSPFSTQTVYNARLIGKASFDDILRGIEYACVHGDGNLSRSIYMSLYERLTTVDTATTLPPSGPPQTAPASRE